MTYRCIVPGSEHEVEYVRRESGCCSSLWGLLSGMALITYRYRGKLYRVTETTWARDYEAVK